MIISLNEWWKNNRLVSLYSKVGVMLAVRCGEGAGAFGTRTPRNNAKDAKGYLERECRETTRKTRRGIWNANAANQREGREGVFGTRKPRINAKNAKGAFGTRMPRNNAKDAKGHLERESRESTRKTRRGIWNAKAAK
jgi:hypothetical protein